MSILLAPYNEAMRLGMGFNSFTQELCINDAVKGSNTTASATTITPNTPQEVNWTAKFVDRVSEVTDGLNVSGSLQIKCDAISGGGSASASFVDMKKFKESDINYFIQVRVTNQRVVNPDLTEFDPITELPEADFLRVYGDSFISGFTEGGEFNALVSIKLKDHSKKNEIRGKLQVALNFDTVKVNGSAKGGKENSSVDIDGETTISVSWRGGGQIKGSDVTDWTLKSLKDVAMAFPENVMKAPLRTHAILTKYKSLKSYYTKKIKGSDADYEIASVYAAALLDAYTDYKVIWRNIHATVSEVQEQGARLEKAAANADLTALAAYYKEHPPSPPVKLDPYPNTILGLEMARKDCRFEMIKIVKEVDAVAADPKVALDAARARQYMDPSIFSMLLPTVVSLIQDGPNNHEQSATPGQQEEQKKAIADVKGQLDSLTGRVKAVEEAQQTLQQQIQNGQNGVVRDPFQGQYPDGLLNTNIQILLGGELAVDYASGPQKGQDYHNLRLIAPGPTDNQKWIIEDARDGGYHIRHVASGEFMVVDNTETGGQRFIHMDTHGSKFTFEMQNGQSAQLHLLGKPEYTLEPETPGTGGGSLVMRLDGDQTAVWVVIPFEK